MALTGGATPKEPPQLAAAVLSNLPALLFAAPGIQRFPLASRAALLGGIDIHANVPALLRYAIASDELKLYARLKHWRCRAAEMLRLISCSSFGKGELRSGLGSLRPYTLGVTNDTFGTGT